MEKRVVLCLSEKDIDLLIKSLYITQKIISLKLLDLRFLYLEENACDSMYYLQRFIGATANKQLYNIKNNCSFIKNREEFILK